MLPVKHEASSVGKEVALVPDVILDGKWEDQESGLELSMHIPVTKGNSADEGQGPL